jgi:hypothetical protein
MRRFAIAHSFTFIYLQEKFERAIINERINAKREYESDTQTFQMQLKPNVPGTYAICIDNRHSMFTSKLVQVCY